MSRPDFTRVLVESTVTRTFHQMEKDPHRGLRSLVDLGLTFTHTRFQQPFLEITQTMLENDQSAYYELIDHLVHHVNQDTMRTVGVNIGYEGLTKGAKVLRSTMEHEDYKIPWIISLLCGGQNGLNISAVQEIIRQGKELGIYCYVFRGENILLEQAEELFDSEPNCAFILLMKGSNLLSQNLGALVSCHNVFISIEDDDNMAEAVEALAAGEFFYGIHACYTGCSCIEGGNFEDCLDRYLDCRPAAVLYLPATPESASCSDELYAALKKIRMEQKYPFVLLEELGDVLYIGNRMSGEPCFLELSAKQAVAYTPAGITQMNAALQKSLETVLRTVLPKAGIREASGQ